MPVLPRHSSGARPGPDTQAASGIAQAQPPVPTHAQYVWYGVPGMAEPVANAYPPTPVASTGDATAIATANAWQHQLTVSDRPSRSRPRNRGIAPVPPGRPVPGTGRAEHGIDDAA